MTCVLPGSQAIKNAQMPQLKEARAQGKTAYFKYTKLIIKDSSDQGRSQPMNTESVNVEPVHQSTQGQSRLADDNRGNQEYAAAAALDIATVEEEACAGGGVKALGGATRKSLRNHKKP
ncbi:hypothetical protein E2C01_083979 [Portunus trituberculatus]|uniref:Uncharacterized protein n=1 Tax=Portunus trituberculatus TaxID=210409 RepID=A0A5B7IU35_PORTR|nr:hypothetical protein [Portunus trituberculatus]